jgi:hypothetical protein
MLRVLVAAIAVLAVAGGGVGAYFAVASGGSGEEAAVSQVTPTPSPVATQQPSATVAPAVTPVPDDWTTYLDAGLGFSFSYRSDWTISTDYYDLPAKKGNPAVRQRSVTFRNAEGAQAIALGITPNPADLTVEDWVASYPGWPSEPESLTLAGQKAILFPINQMGERFPFACFKYGGSVICLSGNIYGSKAGALPPGLSEPDFQRVVDTFTLSR